MSVYQIDLQKPASGGLGISLVSTETQNQTGVFIRTITPGGVADQDGRLKVGDKILQVLIYLILSHTTNFGLFQTQRVYRRQF